MANTSSSFSSGQAECGSSTSRHHDANGSEVRRSDQPHAANVNRTTPNGHAAEQNNNNQSGGASTDMQDRTIEVVRWLARLENGSSRESEEGEWEKLCEEDKLASEIDQIYKSSGGASKKG
ncbi:uncharacterized protein LTR77_001759 [Saxophila tyrrhenica]|uniref:Uncharacterized protein n=1 Tax=Saxophila tyrrhenica TaxID=1690608 RepID=A0AAV9PN10_9PEZI|nr:hypothetical protein LTR77_001759 [Saxophila tyrrhenica]